MFLYLIFILYFLLCAFFKQNTRLVRANKILKLFFKLLFILNHFKDKTYEILNTLKHYLKKKNVGQTMYK